jgi:hypothetical protein
MMIIAFLCMTAVLLQAAVAARAAATKARRQLTPAPF